MPSSSIVATLTLLVLSSTFVVEVSAGTGTPCLGCTLLVGLVEQLAQVHDEPIDAAIARFCGYLPPEFQPTCNQTVFIFGPEVIMLLEQDESADKVCSEIGMCTNYPNCHLFPLDPPRTPSKEFEEKLAAYRQKRLYLTTDPSFEWPWQWIVSLINTTFNYHDPAEDVDGDHFGAAALLETRGSAWRGGDCNDLDGAIYPGRRPEGNPNIDNNCNGIFGVNEKGESYEDLFCKESNRMGFAILGDSVGAHFYAPQEWLQAEIINSTTYSNMLQILLNELDWPQMSATTGYMHSQWASHPIGNVSSIYMAMRQRDRCRHRDFQNISVNGARSSAMLGDIMYSLKRDPINDYPLYVSYALIGDDVCNGHPGLSAMTTPEEMHDNVLGTLEYLDTILPNGSFVSMTGLIDGRCIWDNLHNRSWILGQINNDVTFADYWAWLYCVDNNPCHGWMNANASLRNATTERAFELNYVMSNISVDYTFKNFKVAYFENPWLQIIEEYVASGGQAWQLFNEAIGMHPSQTANSLTGLWASKFLNENYPEIMGPINPYNDQIDAIFGDQGGYQ